MRVYETDGLSAYRQLPMIVVLRKRRSRWPIFCAIARMRGKGRATWRQDRAVWWRPATG